MAIIKIGGIEIGATKPCSVVAEIGINHNGSVELAMKLAEAAKDAGCDFVKLQKRTVGVVYTPEDLGKRRQIPPDTGIMQQAVKRGVLEKVAVDRLQASGFEDTTNGDLKMALELTAEEYEQFDYHCQKIGIGWFASPWDEASVDFLEKFSPPCYKIASASLTDEGLLRKVCSTGRPVVLSTGMSEMWEIERAVGVLDRKNLVVLHCISKYPCNDEDLNLMFIKTLSQHFPDIPIGYSGHEKGVVTSTFAAILGACMVERHLTLDRRMWGSDQAASIEPTELENLVQTIRMAESSRGRGEKQPLLKEEIEAMKKLRRRYF